MTHSHGRLRLSAEVYAVLYITQIKTTQDLDLECTTFWWEEGKGLPSIFHWIGVVLSLALLFLLKCFESSKVLKCVICKTVIFSCCRMWSDSRRARGSVVSSSSSDPRRPANVLLWKTVPNQPHTQPLFLLIHCVKGSRRVVRSHTSTERH